MNAHTTPLELCKHIHTHVLSLTFGEVSGEGGLGLLAVGDQLFGEEVHLDDLGWPQPLHPTPVKQRQDVVMVMHACVSVYECVVIFFLC